MPSEELEKLKQQQHKLEKKLTAAKHKEKQLEHVNANIKVSHIAVKRS